MSNTIFYIMGVSGSGKSTIGKLLSEKTGMPFFDGDDFHPKENVVKMASGQPLNDDDRKGWLEALNNLANKEIKKKGAIIASSALKKSYREILKNNLSNCVFVLLKGDFETIKKRMEKRVGHYMPVDLLKSQFDDLEYPDGALVVDINRPPDELVMQILNKLNGVK